MKLIIQVPCYNEAATLPVALADLPRHVDGFDQVEWLIIDDGSTDGTADVAKAHGVDHVVRHVRNRGLARAFMTGIDAGLRAGADVIVNTDADNQYVAADIGALTRPIVEGRAELAIGARPISQIEHFSVVKKSLQRIGSWVVRTVAKADVRDAPSGFRAFSRNAAQQFVVFSSYTYTLETIIQAGQKNLAVVSVPIRVNGDLRPSRLVRSIPSYVRRSILTIVRIFVIYRPARFFGLISIVLLTIGTILGARFLVFYIDGQGSGHIQSLILTSVALITGFQTLLVAVLADVISANRKLLEEIRYVQRRTIDRRVDVLPLDEVVRHKAGAAAE